MFYVPRSWVWKDLKLFLTIIICLLPSLIALVFNLILSVFVLIFWSFFVIKNAYFKPSNLNILYTRFFFEFLLEKPDLLSKLRPHGLDLFNSQLRDYSVKFQNEERKKFEQFDKYLKSFENLPMNAAARQSFDVMKYFIRVSLQTEFSSEFGFHRYLINQMMGVQSEIVSFLTKYHQISNSSDVEAFLLRVQRISRAFDQLIEQQNERRKRNIETPRFTLERVIDELQPFRIQLEKTPEENPLFLTLSTKLDQIKISKTKQTEYFSRLLKIFRHDLCPAYDRLLKVLREDLANATTDHGVWKLPNGDQFYKNCLEFHTTTNLTPEQIHQMGHEHAQRIQNEMQKILREKNVETWKDFRLSLVNLEKDPSQKYPDEKSSRETILRDYLQIIEDIDQKMDKYFSSSCRPKAKCVVERVPQFKEATSPAAYYFPASLDGKTPGTFFANLRNVKEIVKFKMHSLAYHEAVPGHHFQISIAQSLKNLPFFRRLIPFTAYIEGWALYTEQLTAEEGFLESWQSYLGYLDYQLWRSCRLVVDTGIHWKRWSREQTIDYLIENTCMQREEIVTEVERYFVLPGQACSYMVGCQSILSLREKAKKALQDRFDLKEFHDVILLNGALPLYILETIVDDFIQERSTS